jgi:predicted nucleotidyltransferase
MADAKAGPTREDRIDITHEYELCVWARHFNASEQRIKDAVDAVGDRAERVREHLSRQGGTAPSRPAADRPSNR